MIKQKEKLYVSFILYYEYSNIISVDKFHELEQWVESYFEYSEIIIVNNTSYSQRELSTILNPRSKDIMFLDLGGDHLRDHALRAGIEFSKGDAVFVLPETNTDSLIQNLEQMYSYYKQGNDIVILSTTYSKLKHRLFLKLTNILSHCSIPMNHDLFFLMSKRVVNAYTETTSKILPLTILLRSTGYRVYELLYVPSKRNHRIVSKDEYTLYMMMFSDIMPRVAFLISMICLSISFLSILYAILMVFIKKTVIEGWTTTFLLLSFGLSGIFAILSIISRYLGLFGREIQNSPIYRVRQITKL